MSRVRIVLLAVAAVSAAPGLRAFFGVGDTSFVTVVANPAEAANWAAELARLTSALTAAESTLATLETLRGYAGDPRAAVAALRDLEDITSGLRALAGSAATGSDLVAAWQALGASERLLAAARVLAVSGAGGSMSVFGQSVPRDATRYLGFAADDSATSAARAQITAEQGSRSSAASELSAAWARFRLAGSESEKQAILAEISQIQAEDQMLASRRRALLDDLDLSERQARNAERVRTAASDEALLAESSALNGATGDRARQAEAARLETLGKAASSTDARDYSGLRIWTTGDTGGSP